MRKSLSTKFWVELVLAAISSLLAVLTMVRPDWIEGLFEVAPDGGNGSSEWGITLAFLVATVALTVLTGRTWRRDRLRTQVSRLAGLRPSDAAGNIP